MLRRTLLLLWLAFAQIPAALAAPQNGWWWNPNESGRGFFIEIVDGFAYIGAYVYAPDGRADWVVSQGTMATPTSYSGRLLSFRNGQTLVGDYKAPGPATDVGALTIQFTDDRHATLTWPGGTVPIERLTFDAGTESPVPNTAWWWTATEPGTGFSIEVQGATLFLVGFMYDASGSPVWYYSAGRMASEVEYRGTLLQFANGQPIVGAYRAPTAPVTIGNVSIEFTGPDAANMTFDDGAAAARRVSDKRRRGPVIITPTLTPALPPLPGVWVGTLTEKEEKTIDRGAGLVTEVHEVTLNAVWTDPEELLPHRVHPLRGSMTVKGTIDGVVAGVGSCHLEFRKTVPIVDDDGGTLATNSSARTYDLRINKSVSYQANGRCTVGDVSIEHHADGEYRLTVVRTAKSIVVRDKERGDNYPGDKVPVIIGNDGGPLPVVGVSGSIRTKWNFRPGP